MLFYSASLGSFSSMKELVFGCVINVLTLLLVRIMLLVVTGSIHVAMMFTDSFWMELSADVMMLFADSCWMHLSGDVMMLFRELLQ